MGCIISCRGDGRATRKTLCGKSLYTTRDVIEFFQNKVSCAACLIRQDAMLERGYKQVIARCAYNQYGQFYARTDNSPFEAWPKKAFFVGEKLMWDASALRGALKLAKIGVHNMGVAKQ